MTTKFLINGMDVAAAFSPTLTLYDFIGANGAASTSTIGLRDIPSAAAFTISELYLEVATAPGVGKSQKFTVMKNGVATAATVTIAETAVTGNITGLSVSFAAGDLIEMEIDPTGTPTVADSYWSILAESVTDDYFVLFSGSANVPSNTATNYHGLQVGGRAWDATETDVAQPLPLAGNITALYTSISGVPGVAPNAYEYAVMLDGVVTELLISYVEGESAVKSDTGSVAFTAGQTASLRSVPTDTPTGRDVQWSVAITPTTPGESCILFGDDDPPSTSAVEYEKMQGNGAAAWSATENTQYMILAGGTAKALYAKLSTAPGAGGDAYTFQLREDVADLAGVAVTITDAATSGNASFDVALTAGRQYDWSSTPAVTPASLTGGVHLGLKISFALPPSAAITGTATAAISEADIVAGGKTIIITLTNDTWVASGATFNAQRQNIINGLDSAQAEALGWDAKVKALEVVGAVVRTSDTVVTITLTASPDYDITATETITVTVPATALTAAGALVATPAFTVVIVEAIAYVLEVDWSNDGDYGDTGEDITAATLNVQFKRGRNYASQLTGRATAGQIQALLLNTTGTYSPFNTSSPLTGLLLPGRKIRVRTTGASARTLWTGVLDRIQPQTVPGPWASATLMGVGPMIKLVGKKVNPAANSGDLTGTLITAILTAVGLVGADYDIDVGQTMTGRWFVEEKDALEAIREIEETELGFFWEEADGTLAFEDRTARLTTARSTTSQATFSDDSADALHYTEIVEQDPLREIFNEVTALVQPYTVAAIADLWTFNGTAPILAPGQSQTFIAQYPNDASGGAAGAYVETWTTPVIVTDITQTGVANDDIGIAVVKSARRMYITLTNNNVSASATLTLIKARGTAVTKDEPTSVQASDATSQTAYGKRTYNNPAIWLPTINEAQAFCDYVVSRYKDPVPVLSISFVANKDAAHMTQALTREISDRITIKANGNAELGINADFYIESITHTIDQGARHIVTYELSPATADGGYWILGTGVLGTAKLGY